MSYRAENPVGHRSNHPLTGEIALIVALLFGAFLWERILAGITSAMFTPPSSVDELLIRGLATAALLIGGLTAYAGAYASLRDVSVGLALPSIDDLPMVGLAALIPIALVGLTKLVGSLTGIPYNSLTLTAYGTNSQVTPFLLITGMGLVVAIPGLLLTCQVIVQGSFKQVVGDDTAIVLTTLMTGFLMTSNTGGLTAIPDRGKLLGAVLFVLTLGLALYGFEHVDRRSVRYLAVLPALLFVVLFVFSGIAAIESIAAGLFVTTHVVVLGIAAYTYDRTDSLLVPAIAYLSLLSANAVVVFVFEAGMQSW